MTLGKSECIYYTLRAIFQCIEKATKKREQTNDASILDNGEGSDICILDELLQLQASVPTFATTELDLIHHLMTLYTAVSHKYQ